MRNSVILSLVLPMVVLNGLLLLASRAHSARQEPAEPQAIPPAAPQQNSPQPVAPPPPIPIGPVVVLDPAHGGTDTGARGENGVAEKDIVLQIARTVRERLSRDGYRVQMTRNDDSNPSYDERAAMSNAYRDAIFISLHVSSTGTPGTAHAYYDQFSMPLSLLSVPNSDAAKPTAVVAPSLIVWDQAQRPFLDASHRLADSIQINLTQSFPGSPPTSTVAPVRALRSVAAPAVAIEISSVSGSTPDALVGSAALLAEAISRGMTALRTTNFTGAK